MKDASISLEALWITFTILFIGFLLIFLIWLIGRHYGLKHHRTFAEDDEAQHGFLKELAKEFGYRDSKQPDLRHAANDNFNRNSYNAFCTSSLRSSLIQYGNHHHHNNSNRLSSGLHNNCYNSNNDGSRPNSTKNSLQQQSGHDYSHHGLNNLSNSSNNNNNSNRCSKSNTTISTNSQMLEVITEDEEIGDS